MKLSRGARRTLRYLESLSHRTGQAFPFIQTIAKDIGCSVRSAKYYLAELRMLGYVESRKRQHTSALFTLVKKPVENTTVRSCTSALLDCTSEPESCTSGPRPKSVGTTKNITTEATARAVRKFFPQADAGIAERIQAVARQAIPEATDDDIAWAVDRAHQPGQRSPGLFLQTVVPELRTYMYYAYPERRRA